MNYKRSIEVLKIAATQNSSLKAEVDSAIKCLLDHSDPPQEEPLPGCTYNHEGRCWGQKCTPECTPGYGYCPLAKKK